MSARLRNRLLRYTTLPAVLHLLRRRALTLLSPSSWDDRNDAYYLDLYAKDAALGSVLALCFTQTGETFHHWEVFADGGRGACVHFRRDRLLHALSRSGARLRTGPVRYRTRDEVVHAPPAAAALPFVKRSAFRDEREFRVVAGFDDARRSHDLPIPLGCIDRVVLGPRVNATLFESIKASLRDVPGCERLPVYRTTLLDNADWKQAPTSVPRARGTR